MNTLLHDQDDDVEDTRARGGRRDREITLGTTMVLGIFFCLAAICAVFFGFGYSIGHKSAATGSAAGESTGSLAFNSFKPPSGSPIGTPQPAVAAPVAGATPFTLLPAALPASSTRTPTQLARDAAADAAARAEAATTSEPAVEKPMPAPSPTAASRPISAVPSSDGASVQSAGPSAGQSVVQVAAVSHQEDADMLVSTLKRRGYAVAIRSEPQDRLMHVQIGPFGNRREADAMRQRLQNDGFNAIVK